MARQILLLGDEESAFGFVKVDREKLYGKKQRVVVDAQGRPCQSAWLTVDGTALVPTGGTAHVYVDENWNTTALGARRAVSQEGVLLPIVPSTLGVPQVAEKATPADVLDHITVAVYQLLPEQLGPVLTEALGRGEILRVPFNFRDGFDADVLFVLAGAEGYFGLVSRPTGFEMISREVLPAEDPALGAEEDGLDDDLDFSMM